MIRSLFILSFFSLFAFSFIIILDAQPAFAVSTCNGLTATIEGTTGDDFIEGTSGDDVIAALEGNDFILGKGGNDTICGGDGNLVISGIKWNENNSEKTVHVFEGIMPEAVLVDVSKDDAPFFGIFVYLDDLFSWIMGT